MAQQQTRPTSTAKRPSAPAAAPAAGPQQQKQEAPLPAVVRPRLPWNPALGQQFGDLGVSAASWRTLVEAIWPEAGSAEAVGMALSYCQARKLDPFKRPVHIVPVWNSKLKKVVETVWPGISELRTTAARTGQYAGKDEVKYGPDIELELGDVTITVPEWAQTTVYRMIGNQRVAFAGDAVFWEEAYAKKGGPSQDPAPNAMWTKRKRGQIAKVSEAMALRQAFPEELGGTYSAEEMEGQTIHENVIEGTFKPGPAEPRQRRSMDLSTGEVIDQSPPPHDPNVDPPAPDDVQEAQFEEGEKTPTPAAPNGSGSGGEDRSDDDQRIAGDIELVGSIEDALVNEPPIDRHLAMLDAIDDLREIADAEGWPDKLKARAAALVKIFDEDKAKADAIAARKKGARQ